MIKLLLMDDEFIEESYTQLLKSHKEGNSVKVFAGSSLYSRVMCGIAEGELKAVDVVAYYTSTPDVITFNDRAEPSYWPKWKDGITDVFGWPFACAKRLARALRKVDDSPVHKEVGIVRIAKSIRVNVKE